LEIIRHIQQVQPTLPVAVFTAHGNTDNAVVALKAGAFDYINKPVTLEQLRALVKSALQTPALDKPSMHGLVGTSPAMQQARELIAKLARTQAPVYITGESGSGKELAARLIHQQSNRAAMPFVAVNCGAIPENLMESEFFGYKKGAFTGADSERDGFFQAAQGGTIFLDEVADLPLLMQVKLLRVIQEKKVRKLGNSVEEPVDVRIISATHQNLLQCVEMGRFRQDLFYRLNVISLKMPALREMREDVAEMAQTLLLRLANEAGVAPPRLTPAAVKALALYDFPGNVRELENILERALALASSAVLDVADLHLVPIEDEPALPRVAGAKWPLQDYLDGLERVAIEEALTQTRYNKTAAAKLLGITFRALRYRLERLNIE
jgi:two-component system response regulator PilR (NtrC family)